MAINGTLEDREEIRELHARYCLTIDNGRYDQWLECFTADGRTASRNLALCTRSHSAARTRFMSSPT